MYLVPSDCVGQSHIENLGLRGLLSTGLGDTSYQDRIFSARITGPQHHTELLEALVFSFIIIEDRLDLTIQRNSKALALILLIYPKRHRKIITRFESDLEILFQQNNLLPQTLSTLLNLHEITLFFQQLRKNIINLEHEFMREEQDSLSQDTSLVHIDKVNILSLFNDSASQ